MKDKIVEFIKTNRLAVAAVAFGIVALVLILVGALALDEYVVSVCILIVIEALMAAAFHNMEIWKHAILIAAQVIAAVIIGRIPVIILCVIAYAAAALALRFMKKKEETSPEA